MAGLVPAIHVLSAKEDVDARTSPGMTNVIIAFLKAPI
jgi:hypothetical protein